MPDGSELFGYTGAPETFTLPALPSGAIGWGVWIKVRGGRGGTPDLLSYRASQHLRYGGLDVGPDGLDVPFLIVVGQDASIGRDSRGGPPSRDGGWPNGGAGGAGPGSVMWNRDGYGGGGSTSVHRGGALIALAAGGGGYSGQNGGNAGYRPPEQVLFTAGAWREWGGAVYNPPGVLGIGQSGGPAGLGPGPLPEGVVPGENGAWTVGELIGAGGDGGSPEEGVGGGGGGGGSGTFYDGRRGGGGGAGGPAGSIDGITWHGGGYGMGNLTNAPSQGAGDNVQGDDGFVLIEWTAIIPEETAGWVVGQVGIG